MPTWAGERRGGQGWAWAGRAAASHSGIPFLIIAEINGFGFGRQSPQRVFGRGRASPTAAAQSRVQVFGWLVRRWPGRQTPVNVALMRPSGSHSGHGKLAPRPSKIARHWGAQRLSIALGLAHGAQVGIRCQMSVYFNGFNVTEFGHRRASPAVCNSPADVAQFGHGAMRGDRRRVIAGFRLAPRQAR